jgi:hypothetical protein
MIVASGESVGLAHRGVRPVRVIHGLGAGVVSGFAEFKRRTLAAISTRTIMRVAKPHTI